MKTLCKDGISLYLFDDAVVLVRSDLGTDVGDPIEYRIGDCRDGDSLVHEGVTAPQDWDGGKYTFDGTDWALVKLTEAQKEQATQNAIDTYNASLKALEDAYPQKERDTWPQQVTEARAYLVSDQAATPLIDAMLTTKSDTTKAALVGKIMTNYTAYSTLVGAALGTMQTTLDGLA